MKDFELEKFKKICEGTLKEMDSEGDSFTPILNAFETALLKAGFDVNVSGSLIEIEHSELGKLSLQIEG